MGGIKKTETRTCTGCQEEYRVQQPHQKYCAQKCRYTTKIERGIKKAEIVAEAVLTILPKDLHLEAEDILDEKQMEVYRKSSAKQKVWFHEFLRTGNSDGAAKKAHPNATDSSVRHLSHNYRKMFMLSVQDVYRAVGITENVLAEATLKLINAKKIKRTFVKGDLETEEEGEDVFAINAGIEKGTKMLKIDPAQKILHGEDKDNPFTSLADALKSVALGQRNEQRPELPPNN